MTVGAEGIVGVSARYAAQIRELLYVRAVERLAAEHEAARLAAAQAEELRKQPKEPKPVEPAEEAVKVDVDTKHLPDAPRQTQAEQKAEPVAAPAIAQLVDIQA